MLVNHDREKLINVILYFASHTKHLGKIKLFKLLYLLDFEHFRETGRSVTGLNYHAWEFGPVPVNLMQEWENPAPDLRHAITIEPEKIIDYMRETVVPLGQFDDSHFSKRELRIMASLADQYCDERSISMVDITHVENGAWSKIWNDGRGNYHPIPYELAISEDDPKRESVIEIAREYEAITSTADYS